MIGLFSVDTIVAIVWLIACVGCWQFSKRLAREGAAACGGTDSVLDALTIGISLVLIWAFVLSGFKLLTGTAWLTAVLTTSLGGLWNLESRSKSRTASSEVSTIDAIPAKAKKGAWFYLWGLLATLFAAHVVFDGLLKIPTDFDCLMYHLPLLDEWLQARSLYNSESSYSWTPGNSELIGLWMVAPFSGDFLQALNNVPIVVLWGLSTWKLCRQLGLSRNWSHLATLAVFAVHTTLHETDDASNDLAVTAFATAAMSYALAFLRRDRLCDVIYCGLQLGLLVGVKYFGVGYAGLIGGMLVVLVTFRRGIRRGASVLGWLCLTSLMTGGYWYLRNAWLTGSPIAPMGLGKSNPEVGYPESVWRTSFLGNGTPDIYELGLSALWKMTGPCHFAAVVLVPATIVFLLFSTVIPRWSTGTSSADGLTPEEEEKPEDLRPPLRKSGNPLRKVIFLIPFSRARRFALAGWLATFTLVYLASPFCVEDQPGTLNHLRWAYTPARYGLSFLSIAMISFVVVLQDMSRRLPRFLALASSFVFAGALVWQWVMRVIHGRYEFEFVNISLLGVNLYILLIIMILAGRLFKSLPISGRFGTGFWQLLRLLMALIVAVLLSLGIGATSARWHAKFASFYSGRFASPFLIAVEREQAPRVKIAAMDLQIYPFFGSRRQFRVCRPRYFPDPAAMEAYCRDHGVTHLVTHPGRNLDFDLYHNIPIWINATPDGWEPLQKITPATAYQVFRPRKN